MDYAIASHNWTAPVHYDHDYENCPPDTSSPQSGARRTSYGRQADIFEASAAAIKHVAHEFKQALVSVKNAVGDVIADAIRKAYGKEGLVSNLHQWAQGAGKIIFHSNQALRNKNSSILSRGHLRECLDKADPHNSDPKIEKVKSLLAQSDDKPLSEENWNKIAGFLKLHRAKNDIKCFSRPHLRTIFSLIPLSAGSEVEKTRRLLEESANDLTVKEWVEVVQLFERVKDTFLSRAGLREIVSKLSPLLTEATQTDACPSGTLDRTFSQEEAKKRLSRDTLAGLDKVIVLLNQEGNAPLSIEEWAEISIQLDMVAVQYAKNYAGQFTHSNFQIKNLSDLQFMSAFVWAHLSREAIIDQMTLRIHKKSNPELTSLTTHQLTSGLSVGVSGVCAVSGTTVTSVGKKVVTDDEGCQGEITDMVSVTHSLEAKGDIGIARVGGAASYTRTEGNYREWDDARKQAIDKFELLIEDSTYRDDPEITRYLSRKNTLQYATGNFEEGFVLGMTSSDEVLRFNALNERYRSTDKDIHQHLAILRDALPWEDESKLAPNKKAEVRECVTNPLPFRTITPSQSGVIFKGDYSVHTGSLSAMAEAGINLDGFVKPGDSPFSVSAGASVQAEKLNIARKRFTPLCKRLNDPVKNAQEKTDIKKVMQQQVGYFYPTLMEQWKKEAVKVTGVEKDGVMQIVTTPADGFDVALDQIDDATAKLYFDHLGTDFQAYTNMHARIAGSQSGKPTKKDELFLAALRQKYRADNTQHLLYNMICLNTHLFSRTTDSGLKSKMLQFEGSLMSPNFYTPTERLKERVQLEELINYRLTDYKVSLTAKTGYSGAFSAALNGEVAVRYRDRKHINILRDGNYIDVMFSAGMNRKIIFAKVMAEFKRQSPGAVTDAFEKALDRDLISLASFDSSCMVQLRFFKTSEVDIGWKQILTRVTTTEKVNINLSGTLPIGAALGLKGGYAYTHSHTKCIYEKYHANTFSLFLLQYIREVTIGLIDKQNGKVAAESCWNNVEKEQHDELIKLFTSLGKEQAPGCAGPLTDEMNKRTSNVSDAADPGKLLYHFDFGKNPEETTKQKVIQAQTDFFAAAKKFSEAQEFDQQIYNDCLKKFKAYMLAYFPYCDVKKLNSPIADENPKVVFEWNKEKNERVDHEARWYPEKAADEWERFQY